MKEKRSFWVEIYFLDTIFSRKVCKCWVRLMRTQHLSKFEIATQLFCCVRPGFMKSDLEDIKELLVAAYPKSMSCPKLWAEVLYRQLVKTDQPWSLGDADQCLRILGLPNARQVREAVGKRLLQVGVEENPRLCAVACWSDQGSQPIRRRLRQPALAHSH